MPRHIRHLIIKEIRLPSLNSILQVELLDVFISNLANRFVIQYYCLLPKFFPKYGKNIVIISHKIK